MTKNNEPTPAPAEESKRRSISDAEKATENVEAARRRIVALDKRTAAKAAELKELAAQRAPLEAMLAYALNNPALVKVESEPAAEPSA